MNVSATMSSYSQYVSKKMFSAAPKGIMLNLNDMGNIDGANKKVTYRLILILYVINLSDFLFSFKLPLIDHRLSEKKMGQRYR